MENKSNESFVDIVLTDNKRWFESGDDVSGVVKFMVKKLSSVKINLICVSEVKWINYPMIVVAHHAPVYERVGNEYHKKLRLLNQSYSLPQEYQNLCEGSHEVPFEFKLPEKDIPSTFSDCYGSIKYYIEFVNEEPDIEEGHKTFWYEFKVNAPIREKLNLSIGCSKEKDFGLLSLGTGKIILHAALSKKGWSPGQSLKLNMTVENQSSVEATPRATLYQTQVYMCELGHKAFQILISGPIVGTKVENNKNSTQNILIPIPNDVSLTIKSELISVKYFVHVTLDIPHAIDIHVNIPIVITN